MKQSPEFESSISTLFQDQLDNKGYLAQPSSSLDLILGNENIRVIRLSYLAERIGKIISIDGSEAPDHERMAAIGITESGIKHVEPKLIEDGLYVYGFSGRKSVDPLVRVYGEETDLDLKGIKPKSTAVRFHVDDHKRLAHSPAYLSSHSKSTTLSKNQPRLNSMDRDEIERKSDSSVAKSMATQIAGINSFDSELQGNFDILSQTYRATRKSPPINYRPENALRLILQTDTQLRRILDTSSIGRNLSSAESQEAQRALTYNLYLSDNIPEAWRQYSAMAGRYINAQRGKLDESRKTCTKIYEENRSNIKDAELEEFDRIIRNDD